MGVAGALAAASRWRAAARTGAQSTSRRSATRPSWCSCCFVYLGLPSIGIRLRPDQAALLAMVINLGAYATEIVRAGIKAVPAGQIEAGRRWASRRGRSSASSSGCRRSGSIFPALGSQFMLIMLASSVVSVISAEELTAVADTLVARNFRTFEVYLVVTGMYLVMCLAFQAAFAAIHRAALRALARVSRS